MMNHVGGLGPNSRGDFYTEFSLKHPTTPRVPPPQDVNLDTQNKKRIAELDAILEKRAQEEDSIGMLANLLINSIKRRDELGIFGNVNLIKDPKNREVLRELRAMLAKLGA